MQLKLNNFEGPIELLYNLIDERKLDISQVSMADVTEQYLSHISHYQEKDPKNLAEFLVVAARLILIKSRTLLPSLFVTDEEEEEIKDLQNRLELYRRLREASKKMKSFSKKAQPSFSREFMIFKQPIFLPPSGLKSGDFLSKIKKVVSAVPQIAVLPQDTIKAVMSFEEVFKNLRHRVLNAIHKTFSQATAAASSKMEVILHFLALLELVKQKDIAANQEELFGEIHLMEHKS